MYQLVLIMLIGLQYNYRGDFLKIKINNSYHISISSKLLGYQGETNARTIEFEQPDVTGADSYRLRLRYSDNAVYDVPIIDNKIIVTASLLREVGEP